MIMVRTFVFQLGAEWAPDSPHGLDIVELTADCRFCYENRRRGQVKTRAGWVPAAVVSEIAQALHEAGFPEVPEHSIPPGAGLFKITLKQGESEQIAFMHEYAARQFPGYNELVRRIDAWVTWLRQSSSEEPPPPGMGFETE